MLLLYCSVQSDHGYGQPTLVGIKVGKLEGNSLTMHTPLGLWGICSRYNPALMDFFNVFIL